MFFEKTLPAGNLNINMISFTNNKFTLISVFLKYSLLVPFLQVYAAENDWCLLAKKADFETKKAPLSRGFFLFSLLNCEEPVDNSPETSRSELNIRNILVISSKPLILF